MQKRSQIDHTTPYHKEPKCNMGVCMPKKWNYFKWINSLYLVRCFLFFHVVSAWFKWYNIIWPNHAAVERVLSILHCYFPNPYKCLYNALRPHHLQNVLIQDLASYECRCRSDHKSSFLYDINNFLWACLTFLPHMRICDKSSPTWGSYMLATISGISWFLQCS